MGAAFYEHGHYDNHVMNICNSVKEWIRNTLNVFFTLSNKANDGEKKEKRKKERKKLVQKKII